MIRNLRVKTAPQGDTLRFSMSCATDILSTVYIGRLKAFPELFPDRW